MDKITMIKSARHSTALGHTIMGFSADALKKIAHLRTTSPSTPEIIPKFPPYPDDVKKRFPSLVDHEAATERWRVATNLAITGGSGAAP